MIVWIARDENGDLSMYDRKPEKLERFFVPNNIKGKKISWWDLPESRFPEITWENSPKKYKLKMILQSAQKEGRR